jgi:hypothetical protein
MYDALTSADWVEGSYIQIQVSTDGVNFTTVYTINKDNAYDFEYPRDQANLAVLLTPDFNQYNGERVKVRVKLSLRMTAQFYMEDMHIEQAEVPECDGVYNITAEPMVAGVAKLSWDTYQPGANLWEIRWRVAGTSDWSVPVSTSTNPYLLSGLPFDTKIEVQIRVKCTDLLSSDWTSFIFTTGAQFEPCAYPVNLNVTNVSDTKARLSWKEGNTENLSWDIHYRVAITTTWMDVENIVEKSYLLTGLLPETVYLWSVRARCSNDRTSEWATQSNFETTPIGTNEFKKEAMIVYSSGNMISIINSNHRYIDKVQLFDVTGKLLGDHSVNSTDNVLIPTTINDMMLLVRIVGQNGVETHKVIMK